MKSKFLIISLQVILVLITSCNSTKIVSDVSEKYNFENVKTFSLNFDQEKNSQQFNSLNQERIENAIVSEMEERGLEYDESNADVIVHYYTKLEQEKDIYVNGSMSGGSYGFRGARTMNAYGNKTASVETTTNGFIYIELKDVKDDQMVWYSYGEREIQSSYSGDKASERISAVIEKIMEPLPIEKRSIETSHR